MKDEAGWLAAYDSKVAALEGDVTNKQGELDTANTKIGNLESNAGWVSASVKINNDCKAVDSCPDGDTASVPTDPVDEAL